MKAGVSTLALLTVGPSHYRVGYPMLTRAQVTVHVGAPYALGGVNSIPAWPSMHAVALPAPTITPAGHQGNSLPGARAQDNPTSPSPQGILVLTSSRTDWELTQTLPQEPRGPALHIRTLRCHLCLRARAEPGLGVPKGRLLEAQGARPACVGALGTKGTSSVSAHRTFQRPALPPHRVLQRCLLASKDKGVPI